MNFQAQCGADQGKNLSCLHPGAMMGQQAGKQRVAWLTLFSAISGGGLWLLTGCLIVCMVVITMAISMALQPWARQLEPASLLRETQRMLRNTQFSNTFGGNWPVTCTTFAWFGWYKPNANLRQTVIKPFLFVFQTACKPVKPCVQTCHKPCKSIYTAEQWLFFRHN